MVKHIKVIIACFILGAAAVMLYVYRIRIGLEKVEAPVASSVQYLVNDATVSDLTVTTGLSIKWYTTKIGGTALKPGVTISDTGAFTFFGSQTIQNVESSVRVRVDIIFVTAPSAQSMQTFATTATVSNLLVTSGLLITWYTSITGGTALAPEVKISDTGVLAFYGSQTIQTVESSDRVRVDVVLVTAPEAESKQEVESTATVANLLVTSDMIIKWYTTETGGTALAEDVILSDIGKLSFFGSQTINNVESTDRVRVDVILFTVPPQANDRQVFGFRATVADLQATGNMVKWYQDAVSIDSNLAPNTPLQSNAIYLGSQTVKGVESILRVVVHVLLVLAPIANGAQTIAGPVTIADLKINGTDVKWYSDPVVGVAIPLMLTSTFGGKEYSYFNELISTHYYASQSVEGVESKERVAVNLRVVNAPSFPDRKQWFDLNIKTFTVADLTVPAGLSIKWYGQTEGGVPLDTSTPLKIEVPYWASQTIQEVESRRRTVQWVYQK